MRITCNVLQDLLPLYVDKVLSEDSRKLVEEHLAECEKCREILAQELKSPDIKMQEDSAQPLVQIKRRLLKRNIKIAIAAAFFVLLICLGLYFYEYRYETPVVYEPGSITAEIAEDEVLDLYYRGNYYAAYAQIDRDKLYLNLTTTQRTNDNAASKYDDAKLHIFSINKEGTLVLNHYSGEKLKAKKIRAVYYKSDADNEPHLIWERK